MYHKPVLLKECIDGLNILPKGVYVDATFGGGGHSAEIVNRLSAGHLIAFDQDQEAEKNIEKIHRIKKEGVSFTFIKANFRVLKRFLKFHGITKVDGILADLGISSHQLDDPNRGFTMRSPSTLDMRMDQQNINEIDAFTVVNEYEEKKLVHIFSAYGEIRNSKTLAREIVNQRSINPIKTNLQLKDIAWRLAPKHKEMRYTARVFQAIRIEVNQEIEALKEFLQQTGEVVKQGGRLVVLSYHSLEDRLVKHYINKGNLEGIDEKDFYGNAIRVFDSSLRKPLVPSEDEIEMNSRARSAKLRVGVKL